MSSNTDNSIDAESEKERSKSAEEPEKDVLATFLEKYMNLTEEESKIYLSLLYFGSLTPGEIELYTGIEFSRVQTLLKQMVGKAVIKEIPGIVNRYRVFPPFLGILRFLEESGKSLEQIGSELSENLEKRVNELRDASKKSEEDFVNSLKSIRDDFFNSISSQKDNMNKAAESLVKQISDTMTEILKALEDNISNLKSDNENKINEIISSAENNLNELKSTLSERSTELSQKLDSFEQDARSKLNAIAEKFDSQAKKDIDDFSEKLKTTMAGIYNRTDELIKSQNDKITNLNELLTRETNDSTNVAISDIHSKIDDLDKKFEEVLANDRENHNIIMSKLSNSILTSYEQMINKNREALQNLNNKLTTTTEKRSTEFLNTLSQFDKQIFASITSSKQSADKQLANIKKEISKIKESQSKKIKGQITSLQTNVDKQYKKTEDALTTLAKAQEDAILSLVNSLSEKFSDYSSDINETVNKALDDALNSIKIAFENIKQMVSKKTQVNSQQLTEFSTNVNSTIKEIDQKYLGLYRDSFSGVFKDINQIISLETQRVDKLIEEYTDKMNTFSDKVYNSAFQSFLNLGNSTKSKILDLREKVKSDVEKWSAELSEFASAYNDAISKDYQETRGVISTLIQEDINRHSDTVYKLKSSINVLFDESKNELAKQLTAIADNINTKVTTNLTELKNEQVALNKETKSIIDKSIDETTQFTDEEKQKITATTDAFKSDLGDYLKFTKDSYTEFINVATKNFTDFGEQVNDKTKDILATSKDSIDELLNKTLETSKTWMDDSNDKMSNYIMQYKNNVHELLTNHGNKIDSTVEDFTSNTVGKLFESINGLTTQILDAGKTVITTINEMKDKIKHTNEFLDQAWENATKVPSTIAEKTWHIVGKEAIINRMIDMLRRTKSMITVIVPRIEDIPIDTIKSLKKTSKVHVLVDTAGNKQHEVIKELIAMPNVRVWHRPARDYYACTRDGEEVLIAPAIGSDKEIVALVSEKEEYVILMHKFVGPMWMASSEELK